MEFPEFALIASALCRHARCHRVLAAYWNVLENHVNFARVEIFFLELRLSVPYESSTV